MCKSGWMCDFLEKQKSVKLTHTKCLIDKCLFQTFLHVRCCPWPQHPDSIPCLSFTVNCHLSLPGSQLPSLVWVTPSPPPTVPNHLSPWSTFPLLYLSVSLCFSPCVSVSLFVLLSLHLSPSLSLFFCLCLFLCLSVGLCPCLSLSLSPCLSVPLCLSVCLYLF